MDASVEAVDGDIVLKFKKLLVEEGGKDMIFDAPQNFIYIFSDTIGEGHGSTRGKAVINLFLGGMFKVYDPNQGKWLAHGIMIGLSWGFLMLLAVGTSLLQDLIPPGTTWFEIHEYCNRLNCFFNKPYFDLAVHVIEKSVKEVNSEGKDGTTTVELQSHDKSRGGTLIPLYSPQAPLPTSLLLSSALLLAHHA